MNLTFSESGVLKKSRGGMQIKHPKMVSIVLSQIYGFISDLTLEAGNRIDRQRMAKKKDSDAPILGGHSTHRVYFYFVIWSSIC